MDKYLLFSKIPNKLDRKEYNCDHTKNNLDNIEFDLINNEFFCKKCNKSFKILNSKSIDEIYDQCNRFKDLLETLKLMLFMANVFTDSDFKNIILDQFSNIEAWCDKLPSIYSMTYENLVESNEEKS